MSIEMGTSSSFEIFAHGDKNYLELNNLTFLLGQIVAANLLY